MAKERPISRKAREYLHEFEKWLHDRRPIRSREKRDTTLDTLVDGILPTVEEEIANAEACPNCGGPMLRDVVSGKQRVYCCDECQVEADDKRRGRR